MATLIDPQIEAVLKRVILPDLKKGRKDFDLPHTKAVVFWMKKLLTSTPQLNAKVLITAAYAHDWGYIGLFDGVDSSDLEVIHKMKPLHMDRGSQMITKLIEEKLSKHFSKAEKNRVGHLVLVHDRLESLHEQDELLLMEADTLGMLDADRVTPTFTAEDNATFIEREIRGRRFPRFIHQAAMAVSDELLQKRVRFYAKKKS
jgi:hypothetical protein